VGSARTRIALVALTAACLGTLLSSSSAYARGVAVSPDGRFVYATDNGVTRSYARDVASGQLTQLDGWDPGGTALTISGDGRFVYVGAYDAIYIFSRDAQSGLLTYERYFTGTGDSTFDVIRRLAMSPDGREIYVTQTGDSALHVLSRDPDTGYLAIRQSFFNETTGIDAIDGVVASPDGRHVYAGGMDALKTFARDPVTGLLTPASGNTPAGNGGPLVISPDGRRLYSGGVNWRYDFVRRLRTDTGAGPYETLTRDPQSGQLAPLSSSGDGCSPQDCPQGAPLAMSPDGASVFSAVESLSNNTDNALFQAATTQAGVAPDRAYRQGSGFEGLVNTDAMTWSPDGRSAYLASQGVIPNGGPDAFAVTTLGWQQSSRSMSYMATDYQSHYPSFDRRAQMTIDGGALYTNDPNVTIDVTLPQEDVSFRLANDPSQLEAGPAIRVRGDRRYHWRLATSGATQRFVRRVYLRVVPYYVDTSNLYAPTLELSDDIVLDQSPPRIVSAQLKVTGRTHSLQLLADDNASGVKSMQVTERRARPGKATRYRRHFTLHGAPSRIYVRAIDGAGNYGAWRTARKR
jgi:sugar lactone lactonase YvrE